MKFSAPHELRYDIPIDTGSFENGDEDGLGSEKAGTSIDRRDMNRIGKKQELRRNFRFISILGFMAGLMCTWEAVLFTSFYGITDGGKGGLVWMYVVSVFGFGMAILSMAEMASISPTSGGQYHWVSELAPESAQKFLSFLTGWLCVMGWQVNIASGGYLVALELQGIIQLNDGSYAPQPWHATLMIIAVVTVAIIFNTLFYKQLPLVESFVLFLHCAGFFAVLIPLWIYAPATPAKEVFTSFENYGGWQTTGIACMVGITGPMYALLGPDSAVHMSEEIRDASIVLPRGMMWTLLINGITGLAMLITFCFCIDDYAVALAPKYNFAFIDVFYSTTNSRAGATVMTCIIILMTLASTVSNVATASRQIFAFARDGGVPFHRFLSRVKPGWDIPLNALILSFVVTCLLSLINIGSYVAFNAIVSLSVGSLLTSYIISIGCLNLKRWRGQEIPPRRWSLGKWGATINTLSICYLVVTYVFAFFPIATPVSLSTMNWSIAIYGGVIIFSLCYFGIHARHIYVGPVTHVRRDS